MNPNILIVDEILAVGDQAFQTKCMDRIYKMKREGVTIVMVSHNLDVMRRLCSHLLWLENGQMRQIGPAEEVAQQYQAYSNEFDVETLQESSDRKAFSRMGSRDLEITAVRFLDAAGNAKRLFKTGDSLTIELAYTAHNPILNPEFGLAIHRQDGLHINGPNTQFAGLDMGLVEGDGIVRYTIESLPLLPALYLVTTAVHDSQTGDAYDYHAQAYSFRIVEGSTTEKYGLIAIPATWEWQPEPTSAAEPPTGIPEPIIAEKIPNT
ncbi:MAG TPA: ABC transporter ATP-binding protein [Anaerolineae bacterium]|nr:ABC transporter ATP-binding protein [Anaerolineae bacterium]